MTLYLLLVSTAAPSSDGSTRGPCAVVKSQGRGLAGGASFNCRRKAATHAPLYCATSSPSTNTLSFASSSSASASFNASLTVYSFDPVSVAYFLLVGNDSADVTGR